MFNDVPYVASNSKIAFEALKLLNLKKEDRFVDIGSGDGKVVMLASRLYNLKSYEGIEFSTALSIYSNICKFFSKRRSKIQFHNTDAFMYNYSHCNKVFLYMTTDTTNRILQKIENEIPKGSIVVSAVFKMGDFMKNHEVDVKEVLIGNKKINIYIWEKK